MRLADACLANQTNQIGLTNIKPIFSSARGPGVARRQGSIDPHLINNHT